MVRLKGQLVCMTPQEAEAVRRHLDEHIAASRAEAGCLSFHVSPTDDPLVFEVMEAFRDRAAFDAHQTRTRASDWFAATRTILRNFVVEEVGD